MVERFSQQLQPPSRILHKKEPGGRGWPRSEPTLDNPTSFVPWTPTLGPGLLPHCPITAGCSHKGAKARPVELTHSQGHVPA